MIGKNGNWECPKDYHSVEGVETAQCYPTMLELCLRGSALVPHGEYDSCAKMVVGVIPMIGIFSKDPVDGELRDQGYELTKDAKKCVRAQEVDCNAEFVSAHALGDLERTASAADVYILVG